MSTVEGDIGRPPALRWFVTEPLRGAVSLAGLPFARPLLSRAPRGDGRGVLVLPGLLADDASTGPIRRFLRRLDHRVYGWGLGRNVGPTREVVEALPRRLEHVMDRTGGQPVSLIGWSLGGILARELARQHPDLCSRSSRWPARTWPTRLCRAAPTPRTDDARASTSPATTPHPASGCGSRSRSRARRCTHVPTASSTGGPASSRRPPTHENIEVRAGHLGIGVDAAVLWLLADRLAQPVGEWAPFEPPARLRLDVPALSPLH